MTTLADTDPEAALGPLDALSDRYLPAFESALKFFRTYERLGG